MKQHNDVALFAYLTRFIKPHLGLLVVAAIFLFSNLFLSLCRPYISKQAIDFGFALKDSNTIYYYAGVYALTIGLSIICILLQNYLLSTFGQNIIYHIRSTVFEKILHKSAGDFQSVPIGNWVTRITNDVESLRTLYTEVILKLISNGIMIVGILCFMYAINVPLALVMTLLLPIMGGIIWVYQKFSRRAFRQVRTSVATSNSSIKELLNYIVIVKTYVGEKLIENRYDSVNKAFLNAGLFEVTTFSIFRPLVDGLFFVALIVIFTMTNLLDSVADAGTVFAFIQYMDRFFQPMKEIAEKYNSLQSALAGAERLIPVLDEPKRELITTVPKEFKTIDSIVFDHVFYSYHNDDMYALEDFNLTINRGEYIGIVGLSGSGKSTLLSLLMGILQPTRGSIYINGYNLADYDSSMIRNIMGYVFQNAYLFKGSIEDNLNLYDSTIDRETIIHATKKVNLHSMIEKLPKGYHTPVGYLGALLSDGQKQLLAFARTLILNKPILLLDEATSNIDSHTEHQIQQSIETIRGEKTIINVAHRLSTVEQADRIVVLSYGNIVEVGTFTELMNRKGAFYQLWNHQN
ncbi:ABC transporter ATP-binding protein [Veillonella caviae]|uniref:ABC transporter ATP-binding protein n=1 Tax=Veillonella caviae TaxID=248316 RepID=UPI0023A79D65|nr:ABC transporter ATP-binding protein [Veillonella caviae]MCI5708171.1 ABC transporter ATP-binding protein/permease [Veillonella caviae]MCI7693059.1 ABC transporter ATP-binding protein/permease [Veillonella caviae]MDY5254491.1 ABC transporter ATP-binding protein [Veillonella caviae]